MYKLKFDSSVVASIFRDDTCCEVGGLVYCMASEDCMLGNLGASLNINRLLLYGKQNKIKNLETDDNLQNIP